MATIQKSLQREALQLVFWQLIITMLLSIIILLTEGLSKGLSFLLGGSSYIVPNFIFAWQVFSYASPRLVQQFLIAFFIGEFSKLVLSAILFILIVKYLSINVVCVVLGYVFAIISFWFVCGWHLSRSNISKSRLSS